MLTAQGELGPAAAKLNRLREYREWQEIAKGPTRQSQSQRASSNRLIPKVFVPLLLQ